MHELDLDGALRVHARCAVPPAPATLDPRYVAADAARDAALEPLFLVHESGGETWLHGIHSTRVPGTGLRDASSPYGYGGPLSTSDDPMFLREAWSAYTDWMREHRVAVEYVRFHPLLANDRHYGGHVAGNRAVVSVSLAGDFAADYPPRLRQVLKKARRAGIVYREEDFASYAGVFGAYHREAMRAMGTDPFFLFGDSYFQQVAHAGRSRIGWCVASDGGPWLAAALFLDGAGVREYHLAAATDAGRRAGASSFLLDASANVARDGGLAHLYLGGGSDASPDNPLLFFKGGFSPLRLPYRTGSTVFDAAAYDELKAAFPAEWAAHPGRPIFHRKV